MILDAEAATHLKPWLVRTLEPICDAEPGALADYILALLKHNAPESELRQEINAQLEEFLEKETSSFIDTLFTALRTKSYLPYSAPSPPAGTDASSSTAVPDGGIPIPLDGLIPSADGDSPDRRRKRGLEFDDGDFRPAKGPRLHDDGQFPRPVRGGFAGRGDRGGRMMIAGRADYMDGGMNGAMDMGMGGGTMNGRGAYRPPDRGRGICRDYHNNGYCARGAFCKYSHGEDAVVPQQLFPMNGMAGGAYGPMMGGGDMAFPMAAGANAPYNPHERIDMRPMVGGSMGMGTGRLPNTRTPMLPRHGDLNGAMSRKPGELPVIQDLTPRAPEDEAAQQSQASGSTNNAMQGVEGPVVRDLSLPMNPMAMNPMANMQQQNPFPRQRNGPMTPKGTFRETPNFRGERRQDKTLVVEKIPEDKLSLGAINDWFKRFGTVTNVAVDASGHKALVSFANHEEAYAAWKSEDAVFGNRFVKVFWHRPMEGHGQVGARMLAASAPLIAKVGSKEGPQASKPATPTPTASTSATPRKATPSSAVSALAEKQKLLEKQIAEQKSLMERLASASPEEKKEIMARLRKLNEEMKPSTPDASAGQPSSTRDSRASTPRTDEQAQKERARLDKELEMHHTPTEGESEENTEELRARLEKLKAEAASLGIATEGAEGAPAYGGGFRPYRGRGRGRGFFRGAMRGGPPRTSMKLDNRPKKLLIKGAGSEQLQGVRDWYETTGQVDSVDVTDGGDLLVSFKSRSGAEQGMAKGANIPIIGAVQVSWYAGQPSTAPSTQKASPAPADNGAADEAHFTEARPSSPVHDDTHMHMPEEEMAPGGWGGDDDADDEFGML
ncbi:hypothetical protein PsYK624_020270 [Phanerochaete sordida]|uniref:C3H1-type domain-containing protein n=1 Tax=Phanerochaete sordida TaxID=48140 RepID=A0A9P3L9P6_9APHY|nr:hypothetical protein PsYK624_020270 [Phanerochaete sordida]